MKIALAQINPTVGDFTGNADRIRAAAGRAAEMGADLAVFPELALMGYPPRDLVEHRGVIERGLKALAELAKGLPLPSLVGFVARNESGQGKALHNSAALLAGGRVASVHHKSLLPTYDVFDEDRYFEPGDTPQIAEAAGARLAVTVCEDLWRREGSLRFRYRTDPLPILAYAGARVIVNLSASPFTLDKMQVRRQMLTGRAKEFNLPIVYVNQVGGNDELVFDGGSMVVNADGEIVAQAKQFEEDLLVVDLDYLPGPVDAAELPRIESAFRALALGTRDYLRKCGFSKAVIGLSGGIDSALTACVAAEALGPENVLGVSMPSRFSSDHSRDDARTLAENLGIRCESIPIEPAHEALLGMLAPAFEGTTPDTTEENVQARIRGVILMALSNKFGSILLATGNKSEMAAGYCTLYGDMCGGLAPISDMPKTMVYEIARWINRDREIIPQNTLDKPPSAELKPNQTDQDTLPPYDELDHVLQRYIEDQETADEIAASGIERRVVDDVVRRINSSEYKRRQAVPGIKITSKAFGYGRRIPIAKKMEM